MKVHVRNAKDNSDLENAQVSYAFSHTEVSGDLTTDAEGVATVPINPASLPITLVLTANADGYEEEKLEKVVEGGNVPSSILLSMTPEQVGFSLIGPKISLFLENCNWLGF